MHDVFIDDGDAGSEDIMANRILHVTKEQYETLMQFGTMTCGHIAWMEQKPVIAAVCPLGRSMKVTSHYPAADKCTLSAIE